MINYKILNALEEIDKLIIEELKDRSISGRLVEKDILREARDKAQEAITCILKGA